MVTMNQEDSEIHKNAVVIEAHADIPTDVWLRRTDGERGVLDARHAPRLRKGGLNVQVVWNLCGSPDETFKDPRDRLKTNGSPA